MNVVGGFTLILKDNAHNKHTDDADSPKNHTVGGMQGNQVHDFHVGNLGNVGVVCGARREHAARGTHHHGSGSHGRSDTGAKHHGN